MKKKKNRIYGKICLLMPYLPYLSLHLYPCTLPTAPVSRSFGLRSSYKIDILEVFGLAIATPEGDTVTRNGRAEGRDPATRPFAYLLWKEGGTTVDKN